MTSQQRKDVYLSMLLAINNPEVTRYSSSNNYGICYILREVLKLTDITNSAGEKYIENNLLELYEEKPEKLWQYTNYWWKPGDVLPRINALQNALEKVERSISRS